MTLCFSIDAACPTIGFAFIRLQLLLKERRQIWRGEKRGYWVFCLNLIPKLNKHLNAVTCLSSHKLRVRRDQTTDSTPSFTLFLRKRAILPQRYPLAIGTSNKGHFFVL